MGIDVVATLISMVVGIATMSTVMLTATGRLRTELKGDIAQVRGEMAEMRTELKSDIAGLRTELKADIGRLDDRVARLDDRVYVLATGLAPRLEPSTADRSDNG